jgi:hypothetical protein
MSGRTVLRSGCSSWCTFSYWCDGGALNHATFAVHQCVLLQCRSIAACPDTVCHGDKACERMQHRHVGHKMWPTSASNGGGVQSTQQPLQLVNNSIGCVATVAQACKALSG